MKTNISCLFRNRTDAEAAVTSLENAGIGQQHISVIMRDHNDSNGNEVAKDNMKDGAATGAASGGIIGGLAGLIVGISALAIPGIGAVFIAGPLVAALGLTGVAATTISGGLSGAITGGLVGGLVGLGFSKEDAYLYETHIKEGAILLNVEVDSSDEQLVKNILNENSATEVRSVRSSDSVYA
jgi:hypothetical protein